MLVYMSDDSYEVTMRRAKIISVQGSILVDMFSSKYAVKFSGLPEGARLETAYYDWRTDSFKLVVVHESFDLVASACLLPELTVVAERVPL